jgi:hypothetical protein
MAGSVRIPRSRGGLSGFILVVLGAWGGVAPFVGPTFGYGFTPDRAWQYTPGRLYLSAVPGAVVLLAGLIVMLTRSRWMGGLCACLAALGGLWLIAGASLIRLLPASLGVGSASTGSPLGTAAWKTTLTQLGFYAGLGALIVFFAALALGRFSVAAHKDYVRAAELEYAQPEDAGTSGVSGGLDLIYGSASDADTGPYSPDLPGYPPGYMPGQSQYPPQYPPDLDAIQLDPFPTVPDAGQFPAGVGQYPATQAYPGEQAPFPPAQQ